MQKIIKQKKCKNCQHHFPITDKDLEFYEKISPVFHWEKYLIPTPQMCPECRQKRRLVWRNERNLYKRECDATGKPIISIYHPESVYKIYSQDIWWSDNWDGLDYGRDFDFNQTFFEQYDMLFRDVPKISLIASNNENSQYVNLETDSKDCYMNIWGHFNKDCMYNTHVFNSEDCVDNYWLDHSKHCYECFKCFDSYKLFYSHWCYSSRNSYYCSFSRDLENCFWCVYLENKKYHILNTEYAPEVYKEKIKEILSDKENLENFLSELIELRTLHSSKNNTIQNSENVSWEDIKDSNNAHEIYGGEDIQDAKYIYIWMWIQDTYDSTRLGFQISKCYEVMAGTNLSNVWFSCYVLDGISDTYYSTNCHSSHHLFGCTWLRNKSYCILNKQYTKEEYEQLVPKIIEKMKSTWEWWEFFPNNMSPFGYNETVANEYFPFNPPVSENLDFPLNKGDTWSEAKGGGLIQWIIENNTFIPLNSIQNKKRIKWKQIFNWSDYQIPLPKVEKIIPAEKLPENISDIPDDILNWAIECEVTRKLFRIIKPELEFYRKHNIIIPRKHPDQRHLERMSLKI